MNEPRAAWTTLLGSCGSAAGYAPRSMASRIMYIEPGGGLARRGARVGRVTLSKTGKTLHYAGKSFARRAGYKTNYFELGTGQSYWLSNCRKDGNDALYPTIVEIDEDVRAEYWRDVRGEPARVEEGSFRSEGKHTQTGRRGSSHAGSTSAGRRTSRQR